MIDDIILPKHKEARSFQFSDSSDSKEDKSNILCVMKIAILEEDINNCIPERFNFSNGSKWTHWILLCILLFYEWIDGEKNLLARRTIGKRKYIWSFRLDKLKQVGVVPTKKSKCKGLINFESG